MYEPLVEMRVDLWLFSSFSFGCCCIVLIRTTISRNYEPDVTLVMVIASILIRSDVLRDAGHMLGRRTLPSHQQSLPANCPRLLHTSGLKSRPGALFRSHVSRLALELGNADCRHQTLLLSGMTAVTGTSCLESTMPLLHILLDLSLTTATYTATTLRL